ncbi:MAG: hypothetical protein Q9174_004222, partial [Haloplaca sp. 1 TL-2023]
MRREHSLAPLDRPSADTYHGLRALCSHFKIPSEFTAERSRSVTHSFGWHVENESTDVYWLHSLCKRISIIQNADQKYLIVDARDVQGVGSNQDNGTWRRSGVFLRWRHSSPTREYAGAVEMIIFSPSELLQRNLEALIPRSEWEQAIKDPFCLLVPVLDDLVDQVNTATFKVLRVLRMIERTVLTSAASREKAPVFDFVSMHHIGKHMTHLKESSDAAYQMAVRVLDHHHRIMERPENSNVLKLMEDVHALLQHKRTLLESCQLQTQSMDSRIQNMTNL